MSLIKCSECGKKVSDKATTCPNCGCPVNDKENNVSEESNSNNAQKPKRKSGCLKLILIFFVICIGISIVIAIRAPKKSAISESISASETSTQPEEITEDTKQAAKLADKQIWEYILPIINANNQLMQIIGNESSSNLDIYNTAKNFKEICIQTWSNPPDVSGNGTKEYLDSCKNYIIIEQTMVDSLLTYIDSGKTSDLSKVQKNIQSCTEAISILASNRGVFLVLNGFTDEEIKEIVDNLELE